MRQARVVAIALTLLAAAAMPACKEPVSPAVQTPPESTASPVASPSLPAEVTAFVERWETCMHFAGEEPYDEERKKQIADAFAQHCPGNDATLQSLEAKYGNDAAVMTRLKSLPGRE